MLKPSNLQDDSIAFPTVSGTSSHVASERDFETSLDLVTKHTTSKKISVVTDGKIKSFHDRNTLPQFDELCVFDSVQGGNDTVPMNAFEAGKSVVSDAPMSALDQKREILNGPRRGRKVKEKFSVEEKVVIAGWKGEVPDFNTNLLKTTSGNPTNMQDPNLEAQGKYRKAYFSLIENFLHLQDDIGDSNQEAVQDTEDQTSVRSENMADDFLDKTEMLIVEGLNDSFTSQRPEEKIKLAEVTQPPILRSELPGKQQIESVAGHTLEEMWLTEPQRFHCGSGYETLLMGDSWQDRNQLDSYLLLTSQTHKMELLDLQLQENQRHIQQLEGNRNSLFIEVCEGQRHADAGMLSNEHSESIMIHNGVQSSCSTDVACRRTPGPGQFVFPRRHSVEFQNTRFSFIDKDTCEESIDGRSLDLHCQRIQKHCPKGGPRRQWSPEEDRKLKELVDKYGQQRWSHIATFLQGRKGKQCRERWLNHLRSNIKRDEWTEKEEELLISLHDKYENRWAEIAKHIPGRPENAIKNHWNATKRRRDLRNIKPRKATNGSSDSLEMVQRSMVLRNYLQKHLIDENMTGSKKSRKSGNASIDNRTPEIELPQETVDSSTTVSYQNENSLLDLSSIQEVNSFNLDAMLTGTYKSSKYQDVALSFAKQSNRFEKAFIYDNSTYLQSAANSHIGLLSEFSPFSATQETSLLDYGGPNVGAEFQSTPVERTLWGSPITDLDRMEGADQDCWGQKFTNFVQSLGSHGPSVQNRPFPQNYCCPPALISCEEPIAAAFQGHNLSADLLHRDTHASIKDWFASSPLLEIVKSCRNDFTRPIVDHRLSVKKTSTTEPDVSRHILQPNENSSKFAGSDRDESSLYALKNNQRDFAQLLEDPVRGELVHENSSAALPVYPSEDLSVVPEGQNFQMILGDNGYGYSGQLQQASTTELYTNTKCVSTMPQVYEPVNNQFYHITSEGAALPPYHSIMHNEWMRSESVKQISDEHIDTNKQELDLIELVTLS
ncbi:hypothetical protein O6H91_04G107700 [Diphasiastrum complanatum]|uniref:Uncharacterized protein n=1 Tax=Diphasiastrum complanatum TaxID=34168 RepID=A0ACC2E0G1_DIPCM|nr:hypothetical protein O6H91_04G107700 [Diphasiastrum complanatum]